MSKVMRNSRNSCLGRETKDIGSDRWSYYGPSITRELVVNCLLSWFAPCPLFTYLLDRGLPTSRRGPVVRCGRNAGGPAAVKNQGGRLAGCDPRLRPRSLSVIFRQNQPPDHLLRLLASPRSVPRHAAPPRRPSPISTLNRDARPAPGAFDATPVPSPPLGSTAGCT